MANVTSHAKKYHIQEVVMSDSRLYFNYPEYKMRVLAIPSPETKALFLSNNLFRKIAQLRYNIITLRLGWNLNSEDKEAKLEIDQFDIQTERGKNTVHFVALDINDNLLGYARVIFGEQQKVFMLDEGGPFYSMVTDGVKEIINKRKPTGLEISRMLAPAIKYQNDKYDIVGDRDPEVAYTLYTAIIKYEV